MTPVQVSEARLPCIEEAEKKRVSLRILASRERKKSWEVLQRKRPRETTGPTSVFLALVRKHLGFRVYIFVKLHVFKSGEQRRQEPFLYCPFL